MKTFYEWTVEEMDGEDVVEASHFDTYKKAMNFFEPGNHIGLVRDEVIEAEGVIDRQWAYIKDGKLPEYFSTAMGKDDGAKVPQRFHKEFNAHNQKGE